MRKKILIVVPRLSNGGIEKVASTLSLNLGDDYEQYIFSLCENNDSYGFKSEPFTLDIPIGKNVFEKMLVSLKR
uniref:hypothetical protein n=1 Tax=Vibrio anguillarum TaxID=55601 RepID=UPI001BE480E2